MAALANPATDLAAFLNGKTAAGVALVHGGASANVFVGPLRTEDTTPSPALFLLNTGGPPATSYLGGHRTAFLRPTVQLVVRGEARRHEAGEGVARAVMALLHLAAVPKTGGGTYVSVLARDSAPGFLLEDDSRRPMWSINFECQYKETLD